MIQASTKPGDWCLDFFAGSGTIGAVAAALNRRYLLIDSNPAAIDVIRTRLAGIEHSAPLSADTPVAPPDSTRELVASLF